tara:strand:- start:944 stop:1075 length:132 start_codon:yes stop_codon:yes gene_type:complete
MSRVVIELDDQDVREAIDYVRQHLDNQDAMITLLQKILDAVAD